MHRLKKAVVERLMRYYRFLWESTARKPIRTVTSAQLAAELDIDPTQVRKDLGAIGLLGMGHVGFDVCEVCRTIRMVLGFDQEYEAALIGAGHLGAALAAYPDFARYGLHIVTALDSDAHKIGGTIAGCPIEPITAMKSVIQQRAIRLAILTTPSDVAQPLTDELVAAGVKAIWNFTRARLTVPADVLVRNEHISVGLSEIAYHLKSGEMPAQRHGEVAPTPPPGKCGPRGEHET